jgi:hypothetical protein
MAMGRSTVFAVLVLAVFAPALASALLQAGAAKVLLSSLSFFLSPPFLLFLPLSYLSLSLSL